MFHILCIETFAKRPLLHNSCVPAERDLSTGSNFNPQNTQCIPVVKIFALTRGVHAPRPYGQLNSCPIMLSCRIVLGLEQNWSFFKGLVYHV
jgi:hypothetical protein